ncbi:hypothetical protein GGE16_001489 [Rhizobium leguminosarum]|uniref:Lipoprotein n=1 Tax=Rhizobium leguminosarum TaxID=384 RepID=A0AAE2MHC6_RHILE|nr:MULTISPECIES: hypothetical protein [Rhizobium]MBB4289473.1 hypothetical protein [Rhizobium leguminosarum]MBB4294432.1 hypothetical protein [Rhizobium leguminosarum]MBB4305827.1 hypothetical protein [Rhizobium leguminosarum]MBB4418595.1 hypothetical protein [Rhizobium leguminosarum]MBB4433440.1 hypothetical protein [Rhizobium esperanzae]
MPEIPKDSEAGTLMKRTITTSIILAALISCAGASETPAPFDRPVKVDVVALPKDELNPDAKPKITCSRYPTFMVKEVDLGEVGAERLALLAADAPCERAGDRERVIDDDTAGYLMGVSGGFVFFRAADGWNGGLPFVVYDAATGERLLDDSFEGDNFTAIRSGKGELTLDFRRVYTASCSLYLDTACAKAIAADIGLSLTQLPDCAAAYKAEMKRSPDHASEIEKLPSVIVYPVEVAYAAGETTRRSMDGRTTCGTPD